MLQVRPPAACYELLLVNLALVPLDFVAVQAQEFVRYLRGTMEQ